MLQRVLSASVRVGDQPKAAIGPGVLLLVGVARGDTAAGARELARKVAGLRVFEDTPGKMNLALPQVGGEVLAVPQFTLLADISRGRRPDFTHAGEPGPARELFRVFCDELMILGLHVSEGVFGEHMVVALENDGPVTIILNSQKA